MFSKVFCFIDKIRYAPIGIGLNQVPGTPCLSFMASSLARCPVRLLSVSEPDTWLAKMRLWKLRVIAIKVLKSSKRGDNSEISQYIQ